MNTTLVTLFGKDDKERIVNLQHGSITHTMNNADKFIILLRRGFSGILAVLNIRKQSPRLR